METNEFAKAQTSSTKEQSSNKVPKRVYLQADPGSLSLRKVAGYPLELLSSEKGLERLSRSLKMTKDGRTKALRSTLYPEKTLEQIAEEVLAIFKGGDVDADVLELEEHWSKYTSPISIQAPGEFRLESLEEYSSPPNVTLSEEELRLAAEVIWKFVGLDRFKGALRPLSLEEAADWLPKSTNWGQPWFTPGVCRNKARDQEAQQVAATQVGYDPAKYEYQAYEDFRPYYLDMAKRLRDNLNDELWNQLYAMWYWRGDIGKPDPSSPSRGTKQRDVWGYAHAVSILESAYYSVLTDALRGRPGFVGWTDVENIISRISDNLSKVGASEGKLLMWAFDASGYDKHLGGKLIDVVSRYLVQPVFQEGERSVIEKLSSYSQNCGIITPYGVRCLNRGGNRPSGSGGTNLLDSLEQLVMFAACMLHAGFSEEEVLNSLAEVLGDDGSYVVPARFAELNMADVYKKVFGAVVNTLKEVLASNKTSFLKRIYNTEGIAGCASAVRAVLKMAQYERNTPEGWNEAMENIRCISSLENLSHNPKFEQVIEYVRAGLRLGLGTRFEGGPLALFKYADHWATVNGTSVKTLLDRDDWDRPYQDYGVGNPSSLAVVQYLLRVG